MALNVGLYLPLWLKHPPFREVPSTPGGHNIIHVVGDFSVCGLLVVLGVVVAVATDAAQFIGQDTVGNDGNLLRTGEGDRHGGSYINDHSVPRELNGKFIRHFAGKSLFLAVDLNEAKKRNQENKS